jgi:hypothetical protein
MYNSRKYILGGIETGLQAGKSRNYDLIAARVEDFLFFPGSSYQLWGPDHYSISNCSTFLGSRATGS